MPRWTLTPEQRLMQMIVKRENGCWEWTGSLMIRGGYGQIYVLGKVTKTHRLAWILFKGPIPAGKMILHRCDNPPCCNPDHLYPGTAKDNARDAVERGQHVPGHMTGTMQIQAKLTEDAVRDIRARYQPGRAPIKSPVSLTGLAAEYGVSKKAIMRVVNGTGWTHVA